MSRLWRKQRRLEAKLGEDDERPKGMRLRTYERIVARLNEVQDRKDQAFLVVAIHRGSIRDPERRMGGSLAGCPVVEADRDVRGEVPA